MKVENAKVIAIGEVKKGVSKASGKEWSSLQFVCQTEETYNNTYPIEIFGADKIENFQKYTKVGSVIDVDFNVSASEYEGRWYTKLSYWKSFKSEAVTSNDVAEHDESEELPF
jgi:hypothetical protein